MNIYSLEENIYTEEKMYIPKKKYIYLWTNIDK